MQPSSNLFDTYFLVGFTGETWKPIPAIDNMGLQPCFNLTLTLLETYIDLISETQLWPYRDTKGFKN